MAGWVLLLLLVAMGTAAAAFDLGVVRVAATIAKTSFFVVPVVFMVSLVIGLSSRMRIRR